MGLHWPPAQLTDLVSFIVGIPPDGGGRKPKRGEDSDDPILCTCVPRRGWGASPHTSGLPLPHHFLRQNPGPGYFTAAIIMPIGTPSTAWVRFLKESIRKEPPISPALNVKSLLQYSAVCVLVGRRSPQSKAAIPFLQAGTCHDPTHSPVTFIPPHPQPLEPTLVQIDSKWCV